MNILELVSDIFKSYSKVDDTPLQVGEVMNLWTMLVATENFLNSEKVAYNSVQDEDLRNKMKDLMENYHAVVIKEISHLLLDEGIELTEPPSKKPEIRLDLPNGGRMTDEEVANLIVFNLVWSINHLTRGLTESTRTDVGKLFARFIIEKTVLSTSMKTLMTEKGWIKIPPYFKTQKYKE